jgi:hypothetical protein
MPYVSPQLLATLMLSNFYSCANTWQLHPMKLPDILCETCDHPKGAIGNFILLKSYDVFLLNINCRLFVYGYLHILVNGDTWWAFTGL